MKMTVFLSRISSLAAMRTNERSERAVFSTVSTERIMTNVRNTPLKKELIDCINDIPDEILLTVRPLLHMLIENTTAIETLSYEDLPEAEKMSVNEAMEQYRRGETVRHDDINWD